MTLEMRISSISPSKIAVRQEFWRVMGVDEAANDEGDADVFGVVDNASLQVVGEWELDAADELAVQEEKVRLVKIAKLPSDMVPVVVFYPGWVGACPAAGFGVLEEECAGVVIGIATARGAHEAGGGVEPIMQGAGACEAVKGEVPAAAHTDGEAEPFVFGPADVDIGVAFFEAAGSCVADPGFDRPLRGTGAEVEFVVVGGPDKQVGVVSAAIETGAGAEARMRGPLRLAMGVEGELCVAACVSGLVALALV